MIGKMLYIRWHYVKDHPLKTSRRMNIEGESQITDLYCKALKTTYRPRQKRTADF